jgi:rod shape determining protein RodA
VFFEPNRDPLGAGWNKIQSEIAVGSGGLKGKGYLKGTQNMLGFLPKTVAPTDFIFSVVAEETGFMGSAVVISLFAVILACVMATALLTEDRLGRLLCAGVAAMLFSHVFVNISMTVGLMPVTGLPLPLVSYGGSFVVVTMTALGIVQSVYIRRHRRPAMAHSFM